MTRDKEWVRYFRKVFLVGAIFLSIFVSKSCFATYYSLSFVSNRQSETGGDSNYVSTGTCESGDSGCNYKETVRNIDLADNETVWITFTHNLYSSDKITSNKSWSLSRSVSGTVVKSNFGSYSGYYAVESVNAGSNTSNGATGSSNGSVTFPNKIDPDAAYFINSPRNYADVEGGTNTFLNRDVYKVTFESAGTFAFCEKITLDGNTMTTVCTKIVVKDNRKTERFTGQVETICGNIGRTTTVVYCRPGTMTFQSRMKSNEGYGFSTLYGFSYNSNVPTSSAFSSNTTNYVDLTSGTITGEVGKKYNRYLRYYSKVIEKPGSGGFASSDKVYERTGLTRLQITIYTPYNFSNETAITSAGPLYVGEDNKITFSYTVNPKSNSKTGGGTMSNPNIYATQVGNPKAKLEVCYDNVCEITDEMDVSLSYDSVITEANTTLVNKNVALKDVTVGTEVCIRSMIFPQNSGNDDNYDNADGNGVWAYSDKKCFQVAKRPTLQIWGSSIYINGKVNVPIASKYSDQEEEVGGSFILKTYKRTFGSWVEQSIFKAGELGGLGSGASFGYNSNISEIGGLENDGGGSSEPLTIPVGKVSLNKKSMVADYIDEDGECINSNICNKVGDGDLVVESVIEKGVTKVINAMGKSITITHDIEYNNSDYSSLSEVPKLIIYANNINILCGVSRVDAVLIAEGTVDTCSDGTTDINEAKRSNQLKINGIVIAGEIIAGRTYGAGTGIYSVIPAEIIDYDTSLYLWNFNGKGIMEGLRSLKTVFTTDLPPRM